MADRMRISFPTVRPLYRAAADTSALAPPALVRSPKRATRGPMKPSSRTVASAPVHTLWKAPSTATAADGNRDPASKRRREDRVAPKALGRSGACG